MTLKEIKELIKLIHESELSEFKLKDDKFELSIKTNNYSHPDSNIVNQAPMVTMAAPVAMPGIPAAVPAKADSPNIEAKSPATSETDEDSTEGLVEVKSPIIGTFYRSPSPDKPPYITVGDVINSGDVVCIVEAMKLFNEIESEVSGKIVKVLIEDASPVEYDTPLFLVDPKG